MGVNDLERSFGEILELAKGGDMKSREYIMKKYEPLMYKRSNLFFIKNYDDEDLFQIARVVALKAIDSYDKEKASNFTAYLDKAITNNFTNMLRGISNRNNELSLDFETEKNCEVHDILASDEFIEDIIERKELYSFVKKALDNLSKDERDIINFLYFEGINLKELSELKSDSYSKIRRKRNKILFKIKKYLKSDGITEFEM